MKNHTAHKAYQKSGQNSGYGQVPQPGAPTYTEAWALIEAARRMANAIEVYSRTENPQAASSRNILREPLRLNWRLWTIFQAELISGMDDPNNEMPADLRTNMLTLCQFVDKHTTQALADPQPERLAILIDINRNIASGHMQIPENDKSDTEASQSAEPETKLPEHSGGGISEDA